MRHDWWNSYSWHEQYQTIRIYRVWIMEVKTLGELCDIVSVSYTHLDVYKRQLENDGSKATDAWRKSGDNWFYLDSYGNMVVNQLIDDTYYAVSYTHLDVYKRQGQQRSGLLDGKGRHL